MNSVYLEDCCIGSSYYWLHHTFNFFLLNPTTNPIDLLYKCTPDRLGDVASEYKYMPTLNVSGFSFRIQIHANSKGLRGGLDFMKIETIFFYSGNINV